MRAKLTSQKAAQQQQKHKTDTRSYVTQTEATVREDTCRCFVAGVNTTRYTAEIRANKKAR